MTGGVPSDDPNKKRRKLALPVRENPDINFLGLLIGPRGMTQKELEAASGARILVRGRGASKEGDPDANEDLHVLIVADTEEQLNKATELVNEIVHNPEKRAQVKQAQLQALQTGTMPDITSVLGGGAMGGTLMPLFPSATGQGVDIKVPGDRVGLVIGKGGETIKMIQQQTECSVQVAKENDPDGMRTITLIGSQQAIDLAREEIQKIVDKRPDRIGGPGLRPGLGSGMWGPGMGPAHLLAGGEEQSVVIKVPNNMVGLIIGKGGETIKSLQTRSGARIQVQRDVDTPPGATEREVTLIGTPAQIQTVQFEINAIIQAEQARQGGGAVQPPPGGGIVIKIPNNTVGIVIGKGGETIKMLQQRTGCRIQVSKDESQPERDITLIGNPQQVEMAKNEIYALVRTDRRGGGSSFGAGMGQQAFDPWSQQAMYGYGAYGYYGYPGYPGYDASAAAGPGASQQAAATSQQPQQQQQAQQEQQQQQQATAASAAPASGPPPGAPALPSDPATAVQHAQYYASYYAAFPGCESYVAYYNAEAAKYSAMLQAQGSAASSSSAPSTSS